MKRLQDKRALITGGTSGIGLEMARVFLAEGARVAIAGTNPDTLAAARAELRGDVLAIRVDAGDVAGQAAITASVREAFGGLDVLLVNAASFARTLSGELIERGIRVNAVSPGPVATALHDRLGPTGAALDGLVSQIPLGRRGTPTEIAGGGVPRVRCRRLYRWQRVRDRRRHEQPLIRLARSKAHVAPHSVSAQESV